MADILQTAGNLLAQTPLGQTATQVAGGLTKAYQSIKPEVIAKFKQLQSIPAPVRFPDVPAIHNPSDAVIKAPTLDFSKAGIDVPTDEQRLGIGQFMPISERGPSPEAQDYVGLRAADAIGQLSVKAADKVGRTVDAFATDPVGAMNGVYAGFNKALYDAVGNIVGLFNKQTGENIKRETSAAFEKPLGYAGKETQDVGYLAFQALPYGYINAISKVSKFPAIIEPILNAFYAGISNKDEDRWQAAGLAAGLTTAINYFAGRPIVNQQFKSQVDDAFNTLGITPETKGGIAKVAGEKASEARQAIFKTMPKGTVGELSKGEFTPALGGIKEAQAFLKDNPLAAKIVQLGERYNILPSKIVDIIEQEIKLLPSGSNIIDHATKTQEILNNPEPLLQKYAMATGGQQPFGGKMTMLKPKEGGLSTMPSVTDLGVSIPAAIKSSPLLAEAKKYGTPEEFVKAQGTPVYHGTSLENAIKINSEGFKTGSGKGVSGQTSNDFIYATENKVSAGKYVSDRLGIKNPTTLSANLNGKVLDVSANKMADFEAFGEASKKLGVKLGLGSQGKLSMLDMPAIKKAMQEQGYGAIRFLDRYKNGSKALAILPDNIKTTSDLTSIWNQAHGKTPTSLPTATGGRPIQPGDISKAAEEKDLFGQPIERKEIVTQKGLQFGGVAPEMQIPTTYKSGAELQAEALQEKQLSDMGQTQIAKVPDISAMGDDDAMNTIMDNPTLYETLDNYYSGNKSVINVPPEHQVIYQQFRDIIDRQQNQVLKEIQSDIDHERQMVAEDGEGNVKIDTVQFAESLIKTLRTNLRFLSGPNRKMTFEVGGKTRKLIGKDLLSTLDNLILGKDFNGFRYGLKAIVDHYKSTGKFQRYIAPLEKLSNGLMQGENDYLHYEGWDELIDNLNKANENYGRPKPKAKKGAVRTEGVKPVSTEVKPAIRAEQKAAVEKVIPPVVEKPVAPPQVPETKVEPIKPEQLQPEPITIKPPVDTDLSYLLNRKTTGQHIKTFISRWVDAGKIKKIGKQGEEIYNKIKTAENEAVKEGSDAMFRLKQNLQGLPKEQTVNLFDYVEGKKPTPPELQAVVTEWKAIAKDIADRSQEYGIMIKTPGGKVPFKPRQDYVPYYVDEKKLDLALSSAKRRNELLQKIAEKGNITVAKAEEIMNEWINGKESMFGHLEKAREANLPDEFYKRDPVYLFDYIKNSYDRLSMAKQFGGDDSILQKLIEDARKSGQDYTELQKLVERALGRETFDKTITNISRAARSYNNLTKLSLAAVTNIGDLTKPFIRTGSIWPVLKGIKDSFTKNGIELSEKSGVTGNYIKDMLDVVGDTTLDTKMFKLTGFNWTENKLRQVSVNAAKNYIDILYGKLKKNPNNEFVLRRLQQFGLDGKELLKNGVKESDYITAGIQAVADAQPVSKLDLPYYWQSPIGKMAMQYKTFSYKQGTFIKKFVFDEAKKGNIRPLVILLTAGIAVGEGVADLKALVRNRKRPGWDDPVRRIIDNLMTIGGLGLATDFLANMQYGSLGGGFLKFVVGPTLSDIDDTISKAVTDAQNISGGKKIVVGEVPQKGETQLKILKKAMYSLPVVGPAISNIVFPTRGEYRAKTIPIAEDILQMISEVESDDIKGELNALKKEFTGSDIKKELEQLKKEFSK